MSENNGVETQVLHPGSRLLFRHWEALRGALPCPSRAHFKLDAVRTIVPQLFILEPDPRSLSHRYRLAGTGLTEFYGYDATGRDFLENWDPFERQVQLKVLKTAIRELQPALIRSRHLTDTGEDIGVEVIALPFSLPKRGPNQIIGGLFPFAKPAYGARPFVQRQLVTVRSIWTEHNAGDSLLRSVNRQAPSLRLIEGGKA